MLCLTPSQLSRDRGKIACKTYWEVVSQVAKEKEALNSLRHWESDLGGLTLGCLMTPISLCQTPEAASESRLIGQSWTVWAGSGNVRGKPAVWLESQSCKWLELEIWSPMWLRSPTVGSRTSYLTSLCPNLLICKTGLKIEFLYKVSVRMKWTNTCWALEQCLEHKKSMCVISDYYQRETKKSTDF